MFFGEHLKENDSMIDLDADGKILNRILKKFGNKTAVREAVIFTEAAVNNAPAVNMVFGDSLLHIHLANI